MTTKAEYRDVSAVSTGAISTQFITNERPIDFSKSLYESYPNLTPMTVLLSRWGEEQGTQDTHYWFEEKEMPYVFQVSSALAVGGTALVVVANGDTIQKNTYLYNINKDEIAQVSSDASSNSVTIARGKAGTTAVAWDAGDLLYSLLPAETEGSAEYTNHHAIALESGYNYQQLIRLQFGMTRMANKVETHFGGPGAKRERLRMLKYRQARIMWELNTYFGGRALVSSGTSAIRLAGGLRYFLSGGSNYKDFNGYLTESGFNAWVSDILDNNPDAPSLTFFCARNIANIITNWGRDKIVISPRSTEYGLHLKTYIADVDIDIVPLPLLQQGAARGMGWMIDPTRAKMKSMEPMQLHQDLLGMQSEIIYDLYRQVTSLVVADEIKHGMCVNAMI